MPQSSRRKANHTTFSRTSTALFALPEHAEGSWGDIKPRKFMIVGNWKSNGDSRFLDIFPNDILNNAEYNPNLMDVVVAPTDIHLKEALKNVKNNIKVAA